MVDELCRGEVGILNRLEWSLRGERWEGQLKWGPRCMSTVEGWALGVCSEVIRTGSMQDESHKSLAAAPQSGQRLSQGLGEEARAVIPGSGLQTECEQVTQAPEYKSRGAWIQ